jgi:hypothetical protein
MDVWRGDLGVEGAKQVKPGGSAVGPAVCFQSRQVVSIHGQDPVEALPVFRRDLSCPALELNPMPSRYGAHSWVCPLPSMPSPRSRRIDLELVVEPARANQMPKDPLSQG